MLWFDWSWLGFGKFSWPRRISYALQWLVQFKIKHVSNGKMFYNNWFDLENNSQGQQTGCWYSIMYSNSKAILNSFHVIKSALSVKISPKRPKMASVRYFGSLWMTINQELQGQISACLQRTYICIIYTSHRMI